MKTFPNDHISSFIKYKRSILGLKQEEFAKKEGVGIRFLRESEQGKESLKMAKMVLPAGYTYEMCGEVESRKDSFGGFTSVIIVTVFLFIAALVLLFGTFKSTLIVLSVISLGVVEG